MSVHPSWHVGAAGESLVDEAKDVVESVKKNKTHEALNLLLFAYVGLRLLGVDPLNWLGKD